MSRHLWIFLVLIYLCGPRPISAEEARTVVAYSFDDSTAGLDNESLYFFQNARGRVGYSNEFAWSGYRSIELQEAQFDEEFTELQGRFPVQRSGVFRFHFAIMVENPEEELNIAVAGPEHFRVKKDGIAFWLHTQNGVLVHETDSIPRKLFSINPFQWYFFDVVYDIDRGEYDLSVDTEAGDVAVAELKDQPNASHNPASGVDRFSFIGDLGDRSRVHYFIDDVILSQYPSRDGARAAVASDREELRKRLAARSKQPARIVPAEPAGGGPGTASAARKGYLDTFLEIQAKLRQRPQCLPATSPADFGLSQESLGEILANIKRETLEDALMDAAESPPGPVSLRGIAEWMRGCRLLRNGKYLDAQKLFREAKTVRPGPLVDADLAVALAANGEFDAAHEILLGLEGPWNGDPRRIVLNSFLQSLHGNFEKASAVLEAVASQMKSFPETRVLSEFLAGDKTDRLIAALMKEYPADWRKRLDDLYVAQNYYYNLLWAGQFKTAEDFAAALYEAYRGAKISAPGWRERQADAAFFNGEAGTALEIYSELVEKDPGKRQLWRKLLDSAHVAGDLAREREIRRRFAGQFPAQSAQKGTPPAS